MNKKIVKSNKAPISRSMGPNVRQVIPSAVGNIDPFVFLDHFGPFEKQPNSGGVPPHPHAGIATITYLFAGSNRHQDSYGHDVVVHAGDIAWMQAGKGIIHAEGMNEGKTTPELVHGLQFWISLPAKDKFIEPDFFFYKSADLPTFRIDDATVKVLCGDILGHTSPVKSLSPAYIFEVKIPANQQVEIPIKTGDTCALYMIEGNLLADNKTLMPTTITQFDTEGDKLAVNAVTDCQFMLLGGTALNEPIVGYASYVMNSEEQIRQVIRDYQSGKMGNLTISK